MKLIIQRVTAGSVTVGEKIISKIGKGLVVLVGFHKDDTPKIIQRGVNKLLKLRLWNTIKKEEGDKINS